MEWARLVELVGRVRATSKRGEKVALIADFLRQTHGLETELAALYFTGTLRQGRIVGLADAAARHAFRARRRGAADARPGGRGSRGRGRGDGEWARTLPVKEAVVEGEALALRPDGRPRPFQETMRRLGRSKGIEAARAAMPLASFFFDLLYLEGEGALVSLPYGERIERLQRLVESAALLPSSIQSDGGRACDVSSHLSPSSLAAPPVVGMAHGGAEGSLPDPS